jgi:hypothetical protein
VWRERERERERVGMEGKFEGQEGGEYMLIYDGYAIDDSQIRRGL